MCQRNWYRLTYTNNEGMQKINIPRLSRQLLGKGKAVGNFHNFTMEVIKI